jgi:hypothetical protein
MIKLRAIKEIARSGRKLPVINNNGNEITKK